MAGVRQAKSLVRCQLRILVGWVGIVCGCSTPTLAGGEGESTGAGGVPAGTVVLLASTGSSACDDPSVTSVQVRARKVGCEPGLPAPCTLPAKPEHILGDRVTCPITEPQRHLGVEVMRSGVYEVETVAERLDGPDVRFCFVDPQTQEPARVSAQEVEMGADRVLVVREDGCP